MKRFQLAAKTRDGVGKKSSKSLRKEGLVPAVLYGGEKNIHLSIQEKDLRNLIYTPDIYLVELDIDGKVHECIIQELQFHPVSDNLLHIDFLEVFEEKPIVMEVPVVLDGFAVGVRAGGRLTLDMRKLRVRALYKDIPERLHIDVTKLELGKTLQVGDLSFDNIELLNSKNAVVAAVRSVRVSLSTASLSDDEEDDEEDGEGSSDESGDASAE
ncbi:MAG: 50S ribosomal protein L25/general stress protein Ctc [Porphyromonas sp.]|nr:50S ribosomal protein L25/general stress protein Ctc [Porphyromonas sp.]